MEITKEEKLSIVAQRYMKAVTSAGQRIETASSFEVAAVIYEDLAELTRAVGCEIDEIEAEYAV